MRLFILFIGSFLLFTSAIRAEEIPFLKDSLQGGSPERRAVYMAQAIMRLDTELGFSNGKLLEVCRFIEISKSEKRRRSFYPSHETGLPCDIELNHDLDGYLIYPTKKRLPIIGSGMHKVVQKAIWYKNPPHIVAACDSDESGKHEIKVLQKLQGKRGIVPFLGATVEEKDSRYSIFLTYFSQGSLMDNIIRKTVFTGEQKLKIAKDVAYGLLSMHEVNYIHRDLHSGNVLLRKIQNDSYEAVLIDFGKTLYVKAAMCVIPQAPKSKNPPEILIRPFNRVNRYKTDMYGLGCLFYELLWHKSHSWAHVFSVYELPSYSTAKKEEMYKKIVTIYEDSSERCIGAVFKKKKQGKPCTNIEELKLLTFELLHYEPRKRPDIHEVVKRLEALTIQ